MKTFRSVNALLIVFIFFIGCDNYNEPVTTDYSGVISEMQTFIHERMEADQVTGVAIALVDGKRLVWSEGFGYANKENNIPVAPDTIFEIGSNSKTLATIALMRLSDDGKLNIDDPLTTYIPEFSINQRFPSSAPITIRSILTHHSGLPTDIFIGSFTANNPDPLWTDWLIEYLTGEYTAMPVDYAFAYSNTAFALLTTVIMNASGGTFEKYTDDMFDDMDMHDTTFGARTWPAERISKGYVLGEPQVYIYGNIYASGTVRSTGLDMAKYMSNILLDDGGKILKEDTMNEVFTDQSTGSLADDSVKHGLSFFLNDSSLDYAGRVAWHNGATVDQTSQFSVLLDHGLGAVVLTNSITGGDLATDAVVLTLQRALEAKIGIAPTAPDPVPYSPIAAAPDGLIDSIIGIYVGEISPVFISANDSGGINLVINETELELLYLENGLWENIDGEKYFEFCEVEDDIMMFQWSSAVDAVRIGKLFVPLDISDAWQARVGDWEIINLPVDDASNYVIEDFALVRSTLTLEIGDGLLLMDGPLRVNTVLDPQSDTLAFTAGIGRNRGESVRIETDEDGVETLIVSGAQYRKK